MAVKYWIPDTSTIDFSNGTAILNVHDLGDPTRTDSVRYKFTDPSAGAAVAEILSNHGKAGEVQLVRDGTDAGILGAAFHQITVGPPSGATDPRHVYHVYRDWSLQGHTGRIVFQHAHDGGVIRLQFKPAAAAGYLALLRAIHVYIRDGLLVTSDPFPASGRTEVNSLTLETSLGERRIILEVRDGELARFEMPAP